MEENTKFAVAVCDDEPLFLSKILSRLNSISKELKIGCEFIGCTSADEVLSIYREKNIDAFFLDIDLPKKNGFEAAEEILKIDPDAVFVYFTSHDDYVYKCWDCQPCWFVRKNVEDDLRRAFKKVISRLRLKLDGKKQIREISIEGQRHLFDVLGVSYLEAEGHYVKLFFGYGDKKKVKKIRGKISEFESELKSHGFLRVHKGYIVNCRNISEIKGREVILKNCEIIPISRGERERIRDEFMRYVRDV